MTAAYVLQAEDVAIHYGGVKDALNNSFPGVLRLGYFSDGANLS